MKAPKIGTEKVSDYANVLRYLQKYNNQLCWLTAELLFGKNKAHTVV